MINTLRAFLGAAVLAAIGFVALTIKFLVS